jgi:hypothetical protein
MVPAVDLDDEALLGPGRIREQALDVDVALRLGPAA